MPGVPSEVVQNEFGAWGEGIYYVKLDNYFLFWKLGKEPPSVKQVGTEFVVVVDQRDKPHAMDRYT